jgi:hypothetical protein
VERVDNSCVQDASQWQAFVKKLQRPSAERLMILAQAEGLGSCDGESKGRQITVRGM